MWFAASLFFKSEHSTPNGRDGLWEESVRLIEADTKEKALEKANAIGKKSEVAYAVNQKDSTVWRFVKVERVVEIDADELCDGVELFSRFLRHMEAESLLTPFED